MGRPGSNKRPLAMFMLCGEKYGPMSKPPKKDKCDGR